MFFFKKGGTRRLRGKPAMTVKPKSKSESNITVQNALDAFWDGHLSHKVYARRVRCVLCAVAKRLGEYALSAISRAEIERYKRERFKDVRRNDPTGTRTISPRTVQMELQHLSMAINFAVDAGMYTHNPIKRFIHVSQGRPAKIVLDDGYEFGAQWAAIYNALDTRIKPVALALYETGMRPKECFNMRWGWIREKGPDRWTITVPGSIDKTGNEHDIPVSAPLLSLFRSMGLGSQSAAALVFPSERDAARPRGNIMAAFNTALARCGLSGTGITPYALRRTRITIWDAVDPVAARYAAGHAARDVHFRHYVRISPTRLFKLVGLDFTPLTFNNNYSHYT